MGLTAEQQLRILISTEADLSGLNKAIGSFKRLEQLGKAGLGLNKAGRIIDMTTGRFVSVAEAAAKAEKSVARFDMRLLSVLFAGMALQRTGAAFFKFAFNKWEQYEGYQSASLTKTMELTAAWEFFRFSIFNALGQSDLFVGFIDFVVKAVNWISGFINRFPELATAIAAVFGAFVIGGSVMMILAQFKLAWDALFGAGGFLAKSVATGMGTVAGEAGTAVGAVSSGFAIMKNIVGGGLLMYGVFKLVDSLMNPSEITAKSAIMTALTTGLGVGLLTWNPIAGFLAGGAVLISLIYKKAQESAALVNAQKTELPSGFTIGANEPFFRTMKSSWDSFFNWFSGKRASDYTEQITKMDTKVKTLADGTRIMSSATEELDAVIYKKSLHPSMVLLNEEYIISNEQITSLSGKYPVLIEQTNILATSVNALAYAYERLTKVQTAPSSRFGQTNRHTSSVFG